MRLERAKILFEITQFFTFDVGFNQFFPIIFLLFEDDF